jgi:hypothetical protein
VREREREREKEQITVKGASVWRVVGEEDRRGKMEKRAL